MTLLFVSCLSSASECPVLHEMTVKLPDNQSSDDKKKGYT